MQEGDIIKFNYKDKRIVKCKVSTITGNKLFSTLITDYIGKNEVWYSGETKVFNISEMKNIELCKERK